MMPKSELMPMIVGTSMKYRSKRRGRVVISANEIFHKYAERIGVPPKAIDYILQSAFYTINKLITHGFMTRLSGLGTFYCTPYRKAFESETVRTLFYTSGLWKAMTRESLGRYKFDDWKVFMQEVQQQYMQDYHKYKKNGQLELFDN